MDHLNEGHLFFVVIDLLGSQTPRGSSGSSGSNRRLFPGLLQRVAIDFFHVGDLDQDVASFVGLAVAFTR